MTVREFREWLLTQDQDATVQVLVEVDRRGYTKCLTKDFEPSLSNYVDFTNNQFVKPTDERHGKKFLELGESL